jgi:hypothetical protein
MDKQLTNRDYQVTIKNLQKTTFIVHQKFEKVWCRKLFGVTSHFYYRSRETFKAHTHPHGDSIIVVVRDVSINSTISRRSNGNWRRP